MTLNRLKDINLVLFLSRSAPLNKWDEIGILERELALYTALASRIGKVSIVTSGGEEELKFKPAGNKNIKILYNRWGLSPNLYSIISPVLHHSNLKDGTLYKTNQIDGSWTALIAGYLYRTPVIVRAGYLWAELNRLEGNRGIKASTIDFLQEISFKKSRRIFLSTASAKEYISKRYRINRNKINVIPNYVDIQKFKPNDSIEKIPGRIVFIGRFHPSKNIVALIDACSKFPEINLLLIGDGPQRAELENKIKEKGGHVSFKGLIPNHLLPTEINRAEIFILPSLYEGHPKALIEAMACGQPTIGADVPGIRELLQHGINGLLCGTDSKSIEQAIRKVLNDDRLKKKMGENARDFVRNNFSIERILDLEIRAYESIINNDNKSI